MRQDETQVGNLHAGSRGAAFQAARRLSSRRPCGAGRQAYNVGGSALYQGTALAVPQRIRNGALAPGDGEDVGQAIAFCGLPQHCASL